MTMYRNFFLTKEHPHYDHTSLLLYGMFTPSAEDSYSPMALHSVSELKCENRVKLHWPWVPYSELKPHYGRIEGFDFHSDYNTIGSGSVNGILCLWMAFNSCPDMKILILWNPSIQEYKVIPSSFDSTCHVSYRGFGYDSRRDDYKVMCHKEVQGTYIWEIYSLRTNSWRILDLNVHHMSLNCYGQLNVDGLSHWMCKSVTHNEKYLLSFDWSNEVFITTPMPSYIEDKNLDYCLVPKELVLLNGSIALILHFLETTTFHILVLGELRVKESWTKMFIVGPISFHMYPIGAGRNGDMVFCKKDGQFILFNLTTQSIEELSLKSKRFCKILIHRENLISFEQKSI
ncbi:F-box/kelch-repeat protein At3g06240-like [Vicia villosa]|uniref:F-box/kelch-repeat protein At3g06240-like n=1 Tax=Vicia villosa TaxID=3911 RepID=UPI00273AE78C|nr:F-box/kelch-repeat protein At3g06240-like [Vicia villosa]